MVSTVTSMTPEKRASARRRKALLVLAGLKHGQIAKRIGVTRSEVTMVVGGFRTSRRIKREIARLLRVRVEELWPKDGRAA